MRLSKNGIDILKRFEGCRFKAYQDIVGVWTIGYGFTEGVKEGDVMTLAEANARLIAELKKYEDAVSAALTRYYFQNQFDAIVILAWNIGIAGMQKSTVVKAHNRGDSQAAARAFGLWNKAGGKEIAGLTRRRAAESALYLTPEPNEKDLAMPQAVDEERPMTASTINRAGVIAGSTAGVAGLSQVIDAINKLNLNSYSDWLVPGLLVVTIISVGYIIYERVKQRKNGWA